MLGWAVTVLPNERASVDELMQRADIALYAAKDCGRDEFQFFTDILNQELRKKQRLITALHDALAKNEFSVVFQLQLDTASIRVTGFEALLRWYNQGVESIGTDVFIPLFESSSVVDEVSLGVLEQTCTLAKEIEKEFGELDVNGEALTFGINIAARQLQDSSFVCKVERVLS